MPLSFHGDKTLTGMGHCEDGKRLTVSVKMIQVLGFRFTVTGLGLYMELLFPTEESGPYMHKKNKRKGNFHRDIKE